MKLKKIQQKMRIDVTAERMWEILAQYGDVSQFHAGVVASQSLSGSDSQAAPGCERICHIMDMGLHITLKERIVEYNEGDSYTYEVYEWKNFPLRKMLFGFQILRTHKPYVVLAINIAFRARPAFLTPILAGKMRRLAKDVLLGYKHYAETGARRVPIKQLKAHYKSAPQIEVQYG